MKYIIFLSIPLLSTFAHAQDSPKLKELMKKAETSVGEEMLKTGIELSETLLEAGMEERSAKAAAKVQQAARKQHRPYYLAIALNREGRALEASGEVEAALEKFSESLEALDEASIEDEALRQDNAVRMAGSALNFAFSSSSEQEGEDDGDGVSFTADTLGKRIVVAGPGNFKLDIPLSGVLPPLFKKKVKQKEMGERCESVYHKILDIKRTEVEEELARMPKPPTAPVTPTAPQATPDWERWAAEQTKGLWEAKKVKIDESIAKSFQRLENLDQEELREELLLAELQDRYDSLAYLRTLDSINLEKKTLALREQEALIGQKRTQKSLMMVSTGGSSALALLLLLGFVQQRRNNRLLRVKNSDIEREQQRSQDLLLNILPAAVASELKEKGCASARRFESATVLFTDFKDFSAIAEHLPPEQLVAELDYCFKAFDAIVDRHGLEKIKTIGDSYMCAGGLVGSESCQAGNIVQAALDMQSFLRQWKDEKLAGSVPVFEARIGVHTGPVVAGVVGARKFAYDIWGDTVNVASRMESSGEAGKVNISGSTYEQVKGQFECRHRGKIQAKNKGDIDMYFVENC